MKNALLVYVSHIRNIPSVYDIHKGSRLLENYVSDMTFRNMVVSHVGGGGLLVLLLTPCRGGGAISVVWYVTVYSTRTDRVCLSDCAVWNEEFSMLINFELRELTKP
jgi:hypothetical protein